ncbi:MAG: glycosyltransferase [Acidimicrobiales bacterium]|nr:glycosyltransferase [Acidimicrobiales bacterium]
MSSKNNLSDTILVAPVHYFVGKDAASEPSLAYDFLTGTALSMPNSNFIALCGYWDVNSPIPNNVTVVQLLKSPVIDLSLRGRLFFIAKISWTTQKLIRNNQPRVVWQMFPNGTISLNFGLFCKSYRAKLVVGPLQVFSGYFPSEIEEGVGSSRRSMVATRISTLINGGFVKWLSYNYFQRFDVLVTANSETSLEFRNYFSPKILKCSWESVPLRISDHFYTELNVRDPSVVSLLYVGSLNSNKRPLLAVKVAEALSKRVHAVNLQVVGDGALHDCLVQYISEQNLEKIVELRGQLPSTEVATLMARSQFLLHPSLNEGSSLVMTEAMASGCVPVASRLPVYDDILTDLITGLAIDDWSDVQAVVTKILTEGLPIANQLALKSRELVERFRYPRVIDEYVRILS